MRVMTTSIKIKCLQTSRHRPRGLQEQVQVLHRHLTVHQGSDSAVVCTFRMTTKAAEVYQVWLLYRVL